MIASERRLVATHPGWQSGPNRILALLQMATRRRQSQPDYLGHPLPWETVLGLLVTWHHEFPTASGAIDHEDATELVEAAIRLSHVVNLELASRIGAYHVRKRGKGFVLTHRWNPAIEVADAVLEQEAAPKLSSRLTEAESAWIATKAGESRSLPPLEVLQASAARARDSITILREHQPEGALPESFSLGDQLTVGHAIDLLAALMGFADLCTATANILQRTETTLVTMSTTTLSNLLTKLAPECTSAHVDNLLERLTFKNGRLPHYSPLVRVGDDSLIICPPLIGIRLVDPLVLRSAGYDPNRFGPIGKSLGDLATRWTTWLKKIPGALVAERIKVTYPNGRQAGDLDVLAIDPTTKTAICLEIKWPVDAWALTEVVKVEEWAEKAALQIARVRAGLASGETTAKLPARWPDLSDFTWTWAVGIPRQLCLRPLPEPDIEVTSLRYLLALGEPTNLEAIANALAKRDLPIAGEHFTVDRLTLPLQRGTIHLDVLIMDPAKPWIPFQQQTP
ncbi:hypothetical protein [Lentzea kentuckyensis]|uniref:hypothetical protein n=1 Tax=Lentzea kentuckyensis TaxID=360086 RepID=UPI00117B064D|nr:hypothetical protein [Lentzea kentuckyensis]